VIELRTGTRVWIAAGVTVMRRGFDGLSAQVQNLIGNRNGTADAVHDLTRQFKTNVHTPGPNVEQDVAGCGDGVARPDRISENG
jgi:hypothetical protein